MFSVKHLVSKIVSNDKVSPNQQGEEGLAFISKICSKYTKDVTKKFFTGQICESHLLVGGRRRDGKGQFQIS